MSIYKQDYDRIETLGVCKMNKVILFDLDGTLLPLEMEDFMNAYFKGINNVFNELGFDGQQTFKIFLKATQAMVENDGSKTNERQFWDTFDTYINYDGIPLLERLDAFYQHEFQDYQNHTSLVEGLNDVMIHLKSKGYRLIVATNPLFPEIATMSRIQWSGLDSHLFDEITTYEDYHYAKPNIKYYQEILEKFNIDPKDCLMVGNDAQEDLVVRELGIPTYLITDHLIDRSNGNYQSDYQGTMEEFLSFINNY